MGDSSLESQVELTVMTSDLEKASKSSSETEQDKTVVKKQQFTFKTSQVPLKKHEKTAKKKPEAQKTIWTHWDKPSWKSKLPVNTQHQKRKIENKWQPKCNPKRSKPLYRDESPSPQQNFTDSVSVPQGYYIPDLNRPPVNASIPVEFLPRPHFM